MPDYVEDPKGRWRVEIMPSGIEVRVLEKPSPAYLAELAAMPPTPREPGVDLSEVTKLLKWAKDQHLI